MPTATTTIFGIKNCDTVKKARRWLDASDIDYSFHDFRSDGINKEQIVLWIETIGLDTLINKRSTTWKNLSEDDKKNLDPQTAIPLLLEQPTLIKRPLLDAPQGMYVGFNEKNYLAIFAS